MNLLWIRPVAAEQDLAPDERRIREFLDCPGGVSESVLSLAAKLGIGHAAVALSSSDWSNRASSPAVTSPTSSRCTFASRLGNTGVL